MSCYKRTKRNEKDKIKKSLAISAQYLVHSFVAGHSGSGKQVGKCVRRPKISSLQLKKRSLTDRLCSTVVYSPMNRRLNFIPWRHGHRILVSMSVSDKI